jgi:hypothetical protein
VRELVQQTAGGLAACSSDAGAAKRFIGLAVKHPQDSALTDDAIHFRYPGIVLEAWILLQHLMWIIEEGIAQGRLPRAQQAIRAVHPAFDQPSPRPVWFDSLQAHCH